MKKPEFKIAPSSSMKEDYRALLRRDYSESALEDSLVLLRRVLETSGYQIRFPWDEQVGKRSRPPYQIPAAANDYLKEFLERANASLPAEMPEELHDRTALERRTQEAAVFLTFQSRVTLIGQSGFVRDVQSVLFQLSIYALSPRLISRHLVEANTFLIHALYAHAQLAWTDDPGHQHYLLSVLFEHLEDRTSALHFLRASLENSSPEEHDYLSKAQSYWSQLMEDRRTTEAKAFILDLYRKAAARDLAEVRDLVEETFAGEAPVRRAS